MSKPIIEINHVGKRYQIGGRKPDNTLRDTITGLFDYKKWHKPKHDFWALQDINYTVMPGEAIGIIGRNGAGKSTLLKVLSQITPPTTGSITLRGRVASLLEVGTGFHPELTGRENIFLNGAILGMKRQEIIRNFDSIVSFAEIGEFIDTPVKRYSSGMYVRLAFAVAAHLEPEILIVDEVLSVGDAQFQKKCLGKMESIGQSGRTVLFVSHNMPSIQALCKKGIWLDKGRVVETGDMNTLVANYIEKTVYNSDSSPNDTSAIIIENTILKNKLGQKTNDYQPGDDLTIELHFFAREKVKLPSFWIAVNSHYGPMFIASMLYDGSTPSSLEGRGVISCTFKHMPLLPGLYGLQLGIRAENIFEDILSAREIGLFNVTGNMLDAGFGGVNADQMLGDSTKLVIPYQWKLSDGETRQFQIRPAATKM
ncbi:MAG: ABC transporter ATP-binding protein [Patescibacteria group bacterium]